MKYAGAIVVVVVVVVVGTCTARIIGGKAIDDHIAATSLFLYLDAFLPETAACNATPTASATASSDPRRD